ncbi:MAG: hypothetical protein QM770_03025 [Tepidisphaeraceae bacterium]
MTLLLALSHVSLSAAPTTAASGGWQAYVLAVRKDLAREGLLSGKLEPIATTETLDPTHMLLSVGPDADVGRCAAAIQFGLPMTLKEISVGASKPMPHVPGGVISELSGVTTAGDKVTVSWMTYRYCAPTSGMAKWSALEEFPESKRSAISKQLEEQWPSDIKFAEWLASLNQSDLVTGDSDQAIVMRSVILNFLSPQTAIWRRRIDSDQYSVFVSWRKVDDEGASYVATFDVYDRGGGCYVGSLKYRCTGTLNATALNEITQIAGSVRVLRIPLEQPTRGR